MLNQMHCTWVSVDFPTQVFLLMHFKPQWEQLQLFHKNMFFCKYLRFILSSFQNFKRSKVANSIHVFTFGSKKRHRSVRYRCKNRSYDTRGPWLFSQAHSTKAHHIESDIQNSSGKSQQLFGNEPCSGTEKGWLSLKPFLFHVQMPLCVYVHLYSFFW